jgi:hypothetical protein
MQGLAWTRARAETWVLPPSHRFPAVVDGAAAAALAPLVRAGDWWRELPMMFEPADLIWRDAEALEALARLLAAQDLPLYLERLPADSPTLPALRKAYGAGRVRIAPAMPTPVLELGPAWADGDAAYNAGRRSDFRRLERRAAAFGPVRYSVHAPAGPDSLTPLLEAVWAVEARSWKEAEGSSLSANPWQGVFFRRFAQAAADEGRLRVALLHLGEQLAAMQLGVVWQGRYWLLKISHDQAFNPCSPGQLLLRHTLADAARQELAACEFLGVMADWTTLWTRQTRAYLQVRAYPRHWRASLATLKRGARRLLGR